jgi:hypothetical protein
VPVATGKTSTTIHTKRKAKGHAKPVTHSPKTTRAPAAKPATTPGQTQPSNGNANGNGKGNG